MMPQVARTLAQLGTCLLEQGESAEAEPILRRGLAILEAKTPGGWPCFHTRNLLGGSLLGQGKYAEAEPLLLAGYRGMKAREPLIPPRSRVRLAEAAGRIVALYDAWGKPAEAAAWRARLGLRPGPTSRTTSSHRRPQPRAAGDRASRAPSAGSSVSRSS